MEQAPGISDENAQVFDDLISDLVVCEALRLSLLLYIDIPKTEMLQLQVGCIASLVGQELCKTGELVREHLAVAQVKLEKVRIAFEHNAQLVADLQVAEIQATELDCFERPRNGSFGQSGHDLEALGSTAFQASQIERL